MELLVQAAMVEAVQEVTMPQELQELRISAVAVVAVVPEERAVLEEKALLLFQY